MSAPSAAAPCVFCTIAAGGVPVRVVEETPRTLAFEDIRPQAPVHVLVIPKAHCASVLDAPKGTVERLVEAARRIAREKGLERAGFRLVLNTGEQGGQTVNHLHVHLLAGRRMGWPPG